MAGPRALKKKKRDGSSNGSRSHTFDLERGGHSYGVQPLGNFYLDSSRVNTREVGLGNLRVLRDETLLDILGMLSAKDLARLALVSKGSYVVVHHDELWRALTLDSFGGDFRFCSSWRETYQQRALAAAGLALVPHRPLKVKGFYSDHLFQSWLCASLEVKPEWLRRDTIPRRSNLSKEDFVRDFELLNRPVIITDALASWPALKKWDEAYLAKVAGDVPFACGPVEMTLPNYFKYAEEVQEERPLYVFDPHWREKASLLAEDFSVPRFFSEDLFSVLGSERPDYSWLIIGPARSGSSWHIDPNSTSAWNAVVKGAKKWILFPPGEVPPGVRPSPDGADVATSVSITEWFMNFYGQTQQEGAVRPVEGICRAGEVLFVPHGWWHCVLNLEPSIAITQNYVSRSNLLAVLDFLRQPNAQALVSGTRERESLYTRFKSQFEAQFSGELERIQLEADLARANKAKKGSVWDSAADTQSGGFKFEFNF
eukprot:TRINITY_DN22779_c0_g1_i2.p1 TRINITY_DN22779_c0_g1~~TRINITY_DN22779_c0_g1_i2.p1  ORF type:complete len:484 (+),score=84.20 TRINITY_DN22779_c0_g1_i2:256-1707(+)